LLLEYHLSLLIHQHQLELRCDLSLDRFYKQHDILLSKEALPCPLLLATNKELEQVLLSQTGTLDALTSHEQSFKVTLAIKQLLKQEVPFTLVPLGHFIKA
jgi:hypothetical protein